MSRLSKHWVFILPAIHLCTCLVFLFGFIVRVPAVQYVAARVWEFTLLADLPISLVAIGLAWHYGLLATMWIVIVGTLWWYFLSWSARFLLDRLSALREQRPASIVCTDHKNPNTPPIQRNR